MQSALLTTARFCLCAWVGAAVLFVTTGVREVTATECKYLNQSPVKDELVAVRFPAYYAFGFALLGVSVAALALLGRSSLPRRRRRIVLTLTAAALVMMIADYVWIYRPLLEMITPPGRARPWQFVQYHDWSKYVNAADLGLCLIAAILISLPHSAKRGS